MTNPPEPTPVPQPKPEPPKDGYTPPSSQADLDRIIADRLSRERQKFGDYDDLKAKAAKLDQIEQANATDLERATKKAADEARAEVQTTANARIVRAEARALAAAARFRDPADAVAFLDLKSIKVDDSGDPDADAIKAALKTLGESKPYLLADDKPGKPKPDPSQGGGGGAQTPGAGGKAEAARRFGKQGQQ